MALTAEDVLLMYMTQGVCFFISPKARGLKALCVTLSDEGKKEIEEFKKQYARVCHCSLSDVTPDKVLPQIESSQFRTSPDDPETLCPFKFCRQAPFAGVEHNCDLLDVRSKEEITRQLREFTESGQCTEYWNTIVEL